jgi:hypothetical protein
LAASTAVLAQQPAAETVQQRITTPTSTSTPPTVPTGVSNADLGQIGVVQSFPKPPVFAVSTSQQVFYTDNVFYENHHNAPVGSLGYMGTYTGALIPYSTRDWTPRISLQDNMVRYNNAASGDFDNQNATVSSQYVFGENREWTWNASFTASRYTEPHVDDHEFYREVVYDNQVSNVQQLIKNVSLYFVSSYGLAYHQASPAIYNRLDNALSFSCVYYPVDEVSISGYVRPGARIYVTNGVFPDGTIQNNRDDFHLSVGVDVTWTVCKYVSFSADYYHENDYSNNSYLGYSDSSPGFSVTGSVKF